MNKKFIAKRYQEDKSTAMGQSDVMAKTFDDVIDLSLGDPDMTTPAEIIAAAHEAAVAGHTKYTDFRGDPELRQEICRFYDDEYEIDIADEEVFVAASGCLAMYLALEAIVDDGDEIILQSPYFTPYPQQVELARGVPIELPTYEEEDFQIDTARLESLITDKTKALIINSPNNPTGSCLTLETMKKIAAIAEKHDLLVISDEIYTAYSFEHPFIPFISIPGMKDRTITINSFSKDFVMTGWRLGNIIAPASIISVIQQINENVVFTAPSMSQRAGIYALQHRKELQPPIINEFRERMTYAAERINAIPGMHVIYPPKGSFYLFPNIKKTGMTSEEVSSLILQKAHVLTLPGNAFGACGEGHIRICCTVSTENLKEAFDRIETALK
ncbi:MAG: pyridoxal phosphate-dependent aminotransferase [Bacillota bacterium]|nr:pyridoxal phosphate-dependent aminotransferase [Bacillota bacterium]